MARPVQPVDPEAVPHRLRDHPGPVHHPNLGTAPVRQQPVVQPARIARQHHPARQRPRDAGQRSVIRLPAVVAVAAALRRLALHDRPAARMRPMQASCGGIMPVSGWTGPAVAPEPGQALPMKQHRSPVQCRHHGQKTRICQASADIPLFQVKSRGRVVAFHQYKPGCDNPGSLCPESTHSTI